MKNKENKEVLDKFKKLESELIELLATPIIFDDETKKEVVRKELKRYVTKINKLRETFDEYEKLAKKIEMIIRKDSDALDVSKEVVDWREEDEKTDNKNSDSIDENVTKKSSNEKVKNVEKEEYKDELLVQGDEVVLIKKKKRAPVKEL